MPLAPALAVWLTLQRHDAVHVNQLGLASAPDVEIFQRARKERRVIVTADLDFPRLFALSRIGSPGLILFRGGNYNQHQAIALLRRALAGVSFYELQHSVVVVDHFRLRKTPLPLLLR